MPKERTDNALEKKWKIIELLNGKGDGFSKPGSQAPLSMGYSSVEKLSQP